MNDINEVPKDRLNVVTKLPPDFHMTKYGVDVRLVNEDDSAFILSLRTNPKLSKYLHQTDKDEEKQRQWIREYKMREADGKEYYFIYSKDGRPFGLNRIYNIHGTSCTGGSWLCSPGTDVELSIPIMLILRDIMFEYLGLTEDNFEVRKGNLKVQRFHLMTGCVKTGETDLDILYKATKGSHVKCKSKILKLLNLKE